MTCRQVTKRCPCNRSAFDDSNDVLLQVLCLGKATRYKLLPRRDVQEDVPAVLAEVNAADAQICLFTGGVLPRHAQSVDDDVARLCLDHRHHLLTIKRDLRFNYSAMPLSAYRRGVEADKDSAVCASACMALWATSSLYLPEFNCQRCAKAS